MPCPAPSPFTVHPTIILPPLTDEGDAMEVEGQASGQVSETEDDVGDEAEGEEEEQGQDPGRPYSQTAQLGALAAPAPSRQRAMGASLGEWNIGSCEQTSMLSNCPLPKTNTTCPRLFPLPQTISSHTPHPT